MDRTGGLTSVLLMSALLMSALLIVLAAFGYAQHLSVLDQGPEGEPSAPTSIAFMPDVHFHDVFADFKDSSFSGLPTAFGDSTRRTTIRTMEAQLTSTRLFNENYFAFRAALDTVVERGINHVVLGGDFSDDGQPVHVRGLVVLLDTYHREHGTNFYVLPGNHDPNRPATQPGGKSDYLGRAGRPQPVYSLNHPACQQVADGGGTSAPTSASASRPITPHRPICTDEVVELGYSGLYELVGRFNGSSTAGQYRVETPFDNEAIGPQAREQATTEAQYTGRRYEVCHEGSGGPYRESFFTGCSRVMDMSFLVEPVQGLWLLMLDANVYVPSERADSAPNRQAGTFQSPSNAGYNRVVTHKRHLLDWVEDVSGRANAQGKTLIAFSHYPAADFYNGAGDEIRALWGEGNFQLARVPDSAASEAIAQAGLKVHFGGHMHMNDTHVYHDASSGARLVNVQSPSIGAYVPAFKVLHVDQARSKVEVETVVLSEVDRFDALFDHYEDEWNYLEEAGYTARWNKEILTANSYHSYTDWHIRELSRLRFLPREWPEDMRLLLNRLNGLELVTLLMTEIDEPYEEVVRRLRKDTDADVQDVINDVRPGAWNAATTQVRRWLRANDVRYEESLQQWRGGDLAADFYRLRNAGTLAFRDIPAERLEQYAHVAQHLSSQHLPMSRGMQRNDENRPFSPVLRARFRHLFRAMRAFSTGAPDDHFMVDLYDVSITSMKDVRNPFLLHRRK